jgi:uncharacterized protein
VIAETVLSVRVIPRARTSAFGGMRGGDIVVRLAAPPVEGAANEALLKFLSDALEIPRRAVRILNGERSRRKRVAVVGMTLEQVLARL